MEQTPNEQLTAIIRSVLENGEQPGMMFPFFYELSDRELAFLDSNIRKMGEYAVGHGWSNTDDFCGRLLTLVYEEEQRRLRVRRTLN